MAPLLLSLSLSLSLTAPPEAQALVDAQAAHMWRLVAWGGGSVVAGSATLGYGLSGDRPEATGFGGQAVMWGAIDLAIAGIGLGFPADASEDVASAIAAEHAWAVALWVNIGLDVGYVMTGATLATLGALGAPRGPDLVGHGSGVAVQGLALFVLDLWAVLESGPRQASLLKQIDVE